MLIYYRYYYFNDQFAMCFYGTSEFNEYRRVYVEIK